MSGTKLIVLNYHTLPALSYLQSVGTWFLTIAFFFWIAFELHKLATTGKCDFFTPMLRVAIAVAMLHSIPYIGSMFLSFTSSATAKTMGFAPLQVFVGAMNHSVNETFSVFSIAEGAFSIRLMLVGVVCLLILFMMVVKILVIDIVWPVMFSLVLVTGTLSIPISLIPGMGSLQGWFKRLFEVTLWPIVFHILLVFMASCFKGFLAAVQKADIAKSLMAVATSKSGQPLADAASSWVSMLQFFAVCCAYVILVISTPAICSKIAHSAPAAAIGSGMIAGLAGAASNAALLTLGGTAALGKFGHGFLSKLSAMKSAGGVGGGASAAAGAAAAGGGGGIAPSAPVGALIEQWGDAANNLNSATRKLAGALGELDAREHPAPPDDSDSGSS